MKAPNLKISLIALIVLITIQLNAQIPDSLNVDLPWELVTLPSCEATMGEGPMSEKEGVQIFLDSDIITLNDVDECVLRIKKWKIVDWGSGNIYDFTQIGKMKDIADTHCESSINLHYDDLPISITPNDLLLELNPSHDYSFSFTDESMESILFDNGGDQSVELYVYDFTDNTVCKSSIYLTKCEDDIDIVIPEVAVVEFNQEPLIEVSPEMLGIMIDYPCGTYTIDIKIGSLSNSIIYAHHVGSLVQAKVKLEFSDGTKYNKYIDVNVTGEKPDPIQMYIEDKQFVAGETIGLDVWSDDIEGLVAWGFQFDFINAEILEIEGGSIFDNIPHNIYESGNKIRLLWTPSDGLALNVASNATWFTLTVKPNFDGSTLDMFDLTIDPWSQIAIENDSIIFEYDAEFVFNVEERIVLGVENFSNNVTIEVYPNPATEKIEILGVPVLDNHTIVNVFDLEGKLMFLKDFVNPTTKLVLDISELSDGMYILKTQNGNSLSTHKFFKF